VTQTPLVEVPPDEVPRLREAMRDIQSSVADFYAETARDIDELGRRVRTFLSTAQLVNELLTSASANSAQYRALFVPPAPPKVQLIEGVKYARNVDQHVFHVIRPSDNVTLIGGLHGIRDFVVWDEIPHAAHVQLHPRTQALKASYDCNLLGNIVTETMMDALRFYAAVNPAIIHRDGRGEWTGFPLMSQPGVASPLHPEEPMGLVDAQVWLNGRRPNGDHRVVCGQVTFEGVRYLCGFTFVGRHTFSPFAETLEQVEYDITSGFPYLSPDGAPNLENVTHLFPEARQGAVFCSAGEITSWASPFVDVSGEADRCTWGDLEDWRRVVRTEHSVVIPESVSYQLRRARRLNAFVPPRR
jgi:hypothetical protein